MNRCKFTLPPISSSAVRFLENVNLDQKGVPKEAKLHKANVLTCTCVGIHLGRVEPASPIELTTPRTEAPLARR